MASNEWLQLAPKPKPLAPGKEWTVFLSYRSVNRPWVLNLYDVLTAAGHKVFLDQYVLKPADKLIKNLEDALSKSQTGVLIWSNANRDSVWVNDEYETLQTMANDEPDFILVPVKIDHSPLPKFAANRIYVDFTAYPDGPNGGELLRLLYAICGMPLSPEAVAFANMQDTAAKSATLHIDAAIRNKMPGKLVELFEAGGLAWDTTATLGCKTAEALTRLGNNDEAISVLEKLEIKFPNAIRPKQLKGLALARRGSDADLERAQEILGVLIADNNMDSETYGIYARTWMDRYNKSHLISDLRQSRNYYADAFEREPHDYYTGINAASKSVFLGEMDEALNYADRVEEIVKKEVARGDYWKTATVAEVMLIKKNYADAAVMYKEAIKISPGDTGSINSTWGQAEKLLEKLQASDMEKEMIRKVFEGYLK